ncbi:MAG: hypothetical protein Q4G25_12710 [Paracoccus sp. (in: a-proteobacteria)]|nr:hypothetical protein [Paracoccus sp. (in: a-proteobacteria)]
MTHRKGQARAAAPAAQIGHNGGPVMLPFGIGSSWLASATEAELRRLAKLHLRIERRKAGLAVEIAERQRIMNRCIRRMRRAAGKDGGHAVS